MDEIKSQLTDAQAHLAESHRGFVREIDHSLGKSYGYGGGIALLVVVILGIFGWSFSLLTSIFFWIPGLTILLIALYVVRSRIYARREKLRRQVENYCQINELNQHILHDYFGAEELYPFFAAINEQKRPESS